MQEYLRIGQVLRPHGVKGDIKVLPLTDDAARFRSVSDVYVENGAGREKRQALYLSATPEFVILHLEGVEDRTKAETLRGTYISVDRAHAVSLPEGRYFVADLIGCTVADTEGTVYGTLTDVLETGANDVYVVKGEKSCLVPALKKVLLEVDIAGGRITLSAQAAREVVLFED